MQRQSLEVDMACNSVGSGQQCGTIPSYCVSLDYIV